MHCAEWKRGEYGVGISTLSLGLIISFRDERPSQIESTVRLKCGVICLYVNIHGLLCHCRHLSLLFVSRHVFVFRDTSLGDAHGATRILAIVHCCSAAVIGARAAKAKPLTMNTPSQVGSTGSQSTSCCSLKGGKLPVARRAEGTIAEPCVEVLGPRTRGRWVHRRSSNSGSKHCRR